MLTWKLLDDKSLPKFEALIGSLLNDQTQQPPQLLTVLSTALLPVAFFLDFLNAMQQTEIITINDEEYEVDSDEGNVEMNKINNGEEKKTL